MALAVNCRYQEQPPLMQLFIASCNIMSKPPGHAYMNEQSCGNATDEAAPRTACFAFCLATSIVICLVTSVQMLSLGSDACRVLHYLHV